SLTISMAATLFFGEFLQKTDLVVTTKCVFFPKGDLDYSLLSKYKAFGCVPSSVLDPLHQKQPAITSVTYWETASHGTSKIKINILQLKIEKTACSQ
ncbi:hypothetical protein HMI55_002140, partial [Coelomomyces lativittatus]